ncbi:glyoxylate reductase/hydroxypyruvate reductase-like [Venturia canescens]|uniref:glyoxylate reductase/hydroxypyruvate reductase-like n=1 Tax=Venturia canescens TaxID=32260 RepID=UPI001C9C7D7F|nr:glyoxylate reductase/hydroxypyruvate reductase-like [Venturia canescens]
MGKPKVLVTSSDTPQTGLDLLSQRCEVTIMPQVLPTQEQVLQAFAGHDAIFLSVHVDINTAFLDLAGPSLKVVSTMSAGYDHLDVPEIKRRGIKVGNTPNVLTAAVSEIAVMLMLNAARRAHEARLKLEAGQVGRSPQWLLGKELRNSVIGIVGFGNIGHGIVKRLCGFEVKSFLYTGHSRKKEELGAKFVSLDELLAQSDFVVVAVPLNNETRGLFNENQFSKMKSDTVFVNVGRGAVVKTDDLVKALRNGTIFAAGLDVTDPEPLPTDHELLKLPNAVVVPHIGSATVKTRHEMSRIAAVNLLNGLDGIPMIYPL